MPVAEAVPSPGPSAGTEPRVQAAPPPEATLHPGADLWRPPLSLLHQSLCPKATISTAVSHPRSLPRGRVSAAQGSKKTLGRVRNAIHRQTYRWGNVRGKLKIPKWSYCQGGGLGGTHLPSLLPKATKTPSQSSLPTNRSY